LHRGSEAAAILWWRFAPASPAHLTWLAVILAAMPPTCTRHSCSYAYLVPVTQTAWFSSRTRPSAVVYDAHAWVTLAHTRSCTSGDWAATSAVIGGATSRSHRVASSGEPIR